MDNTSENSLFETFAKGKQLRRTNGSNCVIYTRVSTKEQADTNLSLETQRKACHLYAQNHSYTVMATFGGTFESALTDERKEFTAMLSYVRKCRERISFIIVYSLDRFSRNENSIWLSSQLRTLGIEIVSVTQPIDTSNPSGQMQQKLVFVFNEFENQLRRQKCMAGTREMLLRGDWPTHLPRGYDILKVNGKRSVVINSHGKLIRLAFEMKGRGLSSQDICAAMAEKGFKISHQRISEMLRNPFYCGLLSHSMLEGKIVPGNHEPLVSRELFLRVNGVLQQNAQGYTISEENEAIPLKRFVHCDQCEKPLRGYEVVKKGIHYYKCNTIGCGVNKSAKSLNGTFAAILERLKIDGTTETIGLIKTQMVATFNQLNSGLEDEHRELEKRQQQMVSKIGRLEERFMEEEITADLYNRYLEKYTEERRELEKAMERSGRVSNLEKHVATAVEFATELPSKWLIADYSTKQRMQFLLFPEGIRFSKKNEGCRTTRINTVFALLAQLAQNLTQQKSGIPELNLDYAALVARRGIEPC